MNDKQTTQRSSENFEAATGLPFLIRNPVVQGGAFAGVAIIATIAASLAAGPLVPALSALGGAALAGAAWSFYRFFRGSPLQNIISTAIDNSTEAAFVTSLPIDRGQPLVYANAAFPTLFSSLGGGHPLSSIDALTHLLDDGDLAIEEFTRLQTTANAGAADHTELAFKGVSGAVEWRRLSVQPYRVPGEKGGFVLWRGRDVTARRELDAARRHEEKTLADFLENLPAAFFSADEAGNILYANNKFVEWLGVSAEELRARNMRFADFVVAGSADAATGAPESGVSGDVTLRGPGGSLFKACLVQSEQLDANGDMTYSRSVLLRDLTWRGESGVQGMP
ncbi:MAG: PAS domain S-box protein, partial [Rhodospirillaceae bacterium]|nr:PAS domain S-box protein [Rhodospirillaceae bacterium]